MTITLEIGHRVLRAAAVERGQILKCFRIEAPSVEGGQIVSPEETGKTLKKALLEQNIGVKTCKFLLPSSSAVIREIQVPKIVGKNTGSYVRTQFSAIMEVREDDLTDYISTVPGEDSDIVLGVLVRRQVAEQLLRTAAAAGLVCKNIGLRTDALRNFVSTKNIPADEAYIAAVVENDLAYIHLMEGKSLFVRIAQLNRQSSGEADSFLKDWAVSFNSALTAAEEQSSVIPSFAEQIESIINFQYSRNRTRPVKKVYLYGEADEHMRQEVADRLQLPVLFLSGPEELPYVIVKGASLPGREGEINLLDAMKRKSPKSLRGRRNAAVFAGIMVLLLAAELLTGIGLQALNTNTVNKMDEIQMELNGKEFQEESAKAKEAEQLLKEQKQYNQLLKQYNSAFDKALRFNSSYIGGIYRQASARGVEIEYCDFADGILSITGTAADSSVAAKFAGDLEEQKIVREVSFEGYEKKQDSSSGSYKFKLTGTAREEN